MQGMRDFDELHPNPQLNIGGSSSEQLLSKFSMNIRNNNSSDPAFS